MARIRDFVVDCAWPAPLARFWAAVLDGYAVASYDEEELARLRANGIDDPEDDPTVLVVGGRDEPRFFFQRVDESKRVKNRMHVDLVADDPYAELALLVELGARVHDIQPDADAGWVVLTDPEGNEFCLMLH